MSFWMGVILENQVIGVIDRFDVSGEERRFFKSPIFRRQIHRKYFRLNPKTFLLPGGSLFAAKGIAKLIREHFGNDPIALSSVVDFQKEFRTKARKIWHEVKEPYSAALTRLGVGIPNLDCLLVWVDPSGRLYLANFNDANDFLFFINEAPANWVISPQGPLEEEIGRRIRGFLGAVIGKPALEQREIAKRELGALMFWISERNPFVSPFHDMVFLGEGGTEVFHFGPVKFLSSLRPMLKKKS